jgi:hypothetical protein
MNDKSDAMPCESKAAARASLIKHVIDAKAIKARRCIAFPQRRSTLQSVTILITLQRHAMLWIYNLIPPPRFSPQDEAGRQANAYSTRS